MSVKDMIRDEVERLPEEALAEALDYMLFLEAKYTKTSVVKSAQALSAKSFNSIWDNEEDSAYDKL